MAEVEGGQEDQRGQRHSCSFKVEERRKLGQRRSCSFKAEKREHCCCGMA